MNNSDSNNSCIASNCGGGSCDTNLSFQRTIPPVRQLLNHKMHLMGMVASLPPLLHVGDLFYCFARDIFIAFSRVFFCLTRELIPALFFVSLRTRFLSCHSTVFAKIRFQFLERYLFPRYPGTGWCCCQRRSLCL